MTFRNKNDLLAYIVALADADDAWRLNTGQELTRKLSDDGVVEHSPNEYDALARLLWSLKDEGSIEFQDWTRNSRSKHAVPSYNDLMQAAQIGPTGQGRLVVASSRPSVSITTNQLALGNILNLNVQMVEHEIDAADASDETKTEAKSRLRKIVGVAGDVSTGAAGELLASVLRQHGVP